MHCQTVTSPMDGKCKSFKSHVSSILTSTIRVNLEKHRKSFKMNLNLKIYVYINMEKPGRMFVFEYGMNVFEHVTLREVM